MESMKSMRNVLIHGYDGVDVEIVWKIATEDIAEVASSSVGHPCESRTP